jgi:hypothetical protein
MVVHGLWRGVNRDRRQGVMLSYDGCNPDQKVYEYQSRMDMGVRSYIKDTAVQ